MSLIVRTKEVPMPVKQAIMRLENQNKSITDRDKTLGLPKLFGVLVRSMQFVQILMVSMVSQHRGDYMKVSLMEKYIL